MWQTVRSTGLEDLAAVLPMLAGFALARRFAADGIEHIHAGWANGPATAAWVASRLSGIPFSFSARAGDIFPQDGALSDKLRAAAAIHTNNKANIAYLASLVPEAAGKIRQIYNSLTLTGREDARVHMAGEESSPVTSKPARCSTSRNNPVPQPTSSNRWPRRGQLAVMAGRAGNDGGVVAIILHTVSRRWIPDTIFRYTGRAYSFQVLRIRVSGGQSLRAHQLQGIPPSIVIPSVFQKAGRETACRAASRGLSFRASPPLPFRASPSRQGPGPGQAPPPCRPGAAVPTGRSGPATSPDGDRDPRPGRPGGQGRRNPGPAP